MSKDFNMDNLKIMPIKAEESQRRANQKILHPNLPDIYKGQLIALVAPIRSSKSTTWNNLIMNENMFKDLFSDIFIISNTIATDATWRCCLPARVSVPPLRHTPRRARIGDTSQEVAARDLAHYPLLRVCIVYAG